MNVYIDHLFMKRKQLIELDVYTAEIQDRRVLYYPAGADESLIVVAGVQRADNHSAFMAG